jgi:hypothetical protein
MIGRWCQAVVELRCVDFGGAYSYVVSVAEPTREAGAVHPKLQARRNSKKHATARPIAAQLIETKGRSPIASNRHTTKLNPTQLIENKQGGTFQIATKMHFSKEKAKGLLSQARQRSRRGAIHRDRGFLCGLCALCGKPVWGLRQIGTSKLRRPKWRRHNART